MSGSRRSLLVASATLMAVSSACTTSEGAAPPRERMVRDAWARFADSGATSGAYLTLVNGDTVATTPSNTTASTAMA